MKHVLGRYELIEELGRGAMGVVYKAHDPVLNRIVAVKTMSMESAEDEELRNRLTREANAAAKLKHPNIITVHDYGEHEGVPFIALEFLEGIDLKQIIRNRIALFPQEKLGILKQVALGLGHAHKMGVVHRDVKPSNIRILRDGTVKIMDFGIARIASSQMTRVGTVLGSVDYMSPEQVEGKQVDHRCDQFGFGVVAYEILSETLPFKGNSMPATMNNILQNDPRPLPENVLVPFPGLGELIVRCLQKSPGQRYESFQDVARALEHIETMIASDETTHSEAGAASPDDDPSGDQETIIVAGTEDADATLGTDWQSGEQTVSSARLWVGRDRFQNISASLEHLERRKPKPPVRKTAASRTPASRVGATSRVPSVSTPPPRPGHGKLIGVAFAAVLAVAVGLGWYVLGRGDSANESTTQVEEFVNARLRASAARLEQQDYRGAIEDLERLLEVQPAHAEALAQLEHVRAQLDDRFESSYQQAQELVASGELEAASRAIDAALALKPDHPEATALRDETLARLSEQRSAADRQTRLAELTATGREQLQAGRASEALATLRSAATIDPKNSEVQELLQRAQRAVGQRSRAAEAYRAGVAALERDDLDEAVAELERAVQLDPNHREAKRRLAEARQEQARPRFGTLTINALPFGEAFLDGESLGTTPVRIEQIAAGTHTVRVVKVGYREFTRTVVVEEGQTTNVVAQLERNP